jgi:hypothetical protein
MLRKMNGLPSAETICLSDGSWTDLAPPNQILRLHLVVIKQREESFPVSVILRRSLVEAPLCIRWLGKIEIHVPALLCDRVLLILLLLLPLSLLGFEHWMEVAVG